MEPIKNKNNAMSEKEIIENLIFISDLLQSKNLDECLTKNKTELDKCYKAFDLITQSNLKVEEKRKKFFYYWKNLYENLLITIVHSCSNGNCNLYSIQDKLLFIEGIKEKIKKSELSRNVDDIIIFSKSINIDKYNACIDEIIKKLSNFDREKVFLTNYKNKYKNTNNAPGIEMFLVLSVSYALIKLEEKFKESRDNLKENHKHNIAPINHILIALFHSRKFLQDSLLVKKVDNIIKSWDIALTNSINHTSYLYLEAIKDKKEYHTRKLKETAENVINARLEIKKHQETISKLQNDINNLLEDEESLKRQLEVCKYNEKSKLENSNDINLIEYYDNLNLGSGSSSDVILVVNPKTNEQLSAKVGRKLNTSGTFLEKIKKLSWVKQEIDSSMIISSSRTSKLYKIENFEFHRCLIMPVLPYNDVDTNLKLFTSNRVGEINYFYMTYVENLKSHKKIEEDKNVSFPIKKEKKEFGTNHITEDSYEKLKSNTSQFEINFFKKIRFSFILYILNELYEILKILEKFNSSHRDFEPQNILFSEDFSALMIDFQQNTFCNKEEFVKTNSHGTSLYQGPDKYYELDKMNSELNLKLDYYSLGVILQKLSNNFYYADFINKHLNKININKKISRLYYDLEGNEERDENENEKKKNYDGNIFDYESKKQKSNNLYTTEECSNIEEEKYTNNGAMRKSVKKPIESYWKHVIQYYFFKKINELNDKCKDFKHIVDKDNFYKIFLEKIVFHISGIKSSSKLIDIINFETTLKDLSEVSTYNDSVISSTTIEKSNKNNYPNMEINFDYKMINELIVDLINPTIKDRIGLKEIQDKVLKINSRKLEDIYACKKIFENMENNNKIDKTDSLKETIKKRANRKPLIELQKLDFYQDLTSSSFIENKLMKTSQYYFNKKIHLKEEL